MIHRPPSSRSTLATTAPLRALAAACLAVLTLSASSSAHAAWADTFTRDAVSSQSAADESVIVLAAAGPRSTSLSAAEAALRAALEGRVTLKQLPTSDLGSADDPSIVALSRTVGEVDAIMILRVFEGERATAVVSVFAQSGALKRAFTATEGIPLAVRSDKTGRGVTVEQMKRVGDATGHVNAETESSNEDERRYKKEMIVVGTQVAMYQGPYNEGGVIIGRTGLYQDGQLIGSEPELYRIVGREDLAEDYESAETSKSIVWGAGLAVTSLGAVLMLVDVMSFDAESEAPPSMDMMIAGGVLGGLGLVAMLISSGMDPSQSSPSEMRGLINHHNEQLRKKYGLEDETVSERGFAPQLQLMASPSALGLRLSGSF